MFLYIKDAVRKSFGFLCIKGELSRDYNIMGIDLFSNAS